MPTFVTITHPELGTAEVIEKVRTVWQPSCSYWI